jgi:hypothetical protein
MPQVSQVPDEANTKVAERYWGNLTDEQLIEHAFTTEDPEALEGLVLEVPVAEGVPKIEFAYDFRGSKRTNLRCAHCRYPNHLAGFVIKTDDGQRFLCGHKCGGKIYGAEFAAFKKDFDHARERASLLRRWRAMRASLPAFLDWLKQLGDAPTWAQYSSVRQDIRTKMARLYGELHIAGRKDGQLFIEERVRDFQAEVRDEERYERELADWDGETVTERKKLRREGLEPEKPRKPLYTTVPRLLGNVQTGTLFATEKSPKQNLDAVVQVFSVVASLDDTQRSNREMATNLAKVGNLLDQITQQIDRLDEVPAFFTPATLGPVAEWATARDDIPGKFSAALTSLTMIDGQGTHHAVQVPKDYRVPSKSRLADFRRAINLP